MKKIAYFLSITMLLSFLGTNCFANYIIVDTGETLCYDTSRAITPPTQG